MPRWSIWAVLLPLVVAGTVTAYDSHADEGVAIAAGVLSGGRDETPGHVLGAGSLVAGLAWAAVGASRGAGSSGPGSRSGGDATAPVVLLAPAASVWVVWLVGVFVDRAPLD